MIVPATCTRVLAEIGVLSCTDELVTRQRSPIAGRRGRSTCAARLPRTRPATQPGAQTACNRNLSSSMSAPGLSPGHPTVRCLRPQVRSRRAGSPRRGSTGRGSFGGRARRPLPLAEQLTKTRQQCFGRRGLAVPIRRPPRRRRRGSPHHGHHHPGHLLDRHVEPRAPEVRPDPGRADLGAVPSPRATFHGLHDRIHRGLCRPVGHPCGQTLHAFQRQAEVHPPPGFIVVDHLAPLDSTLRTAPRAGLRRI
jgi:hypothetical protein